jgi:predicted nucleic acid-binding protein
VGAGSVLEWDQDGDNIVVRKAGRHTSADIHAALFRKPPRRRGLAELKDGIRSQMRRKQVVLVVAMLLEHAHLTIQDADVAEAALRDFRARPSTGFTDCLLVATARKAGHLLVGTFDRRLARLDGAQLV